MLAKLRSSRRPRLPVGHEVGTALTLPIYAAACGSRHIFRRHSFVTFSAPTRHSFVVSIGDVLSSFPPTRRRLAAGALLLALALFVGGRHVLHAGVPAQAAAPAGPAVAIRADQGPQLVVHVVGAVHRPGLYRLPARSRVADAVTRAGGPTRRADLSLVNLAAPLSDGTQVVVPVRASPSAAAGVAGAASTPAGPVHLNSATLEQLDSLPGVGPVTAQKILDYRQKHGAFSSLDELDAIPGIGEARIEQLRDAAAP
jgi:competence protein ComEA